MYKLGLIVLVLLTGCAATPVASTLVGECLITNQDSYIWESYNNIYAGEYLIAGTEKPMLTDESNYIGVLKKDTELEIANVLRGSNGSYGRFLRFSVRVLDGSHDGKVIDIPACVPYHPRPRWITNCTSNPNELELNSQMVRQCT